MSSPRKPCNVAFVTGSWRKQLTYEKRPRPLLDMLEAIQKIEQYASDESFSSRDENLVEVWMIHHLQIIGEAASRVSNEIREKHPEVAWGGMIGMRHVL